MFLKGFHLIVAGVLPIKKIKPKLNIKSEMETGFSISAENQYIPQFRAQRLV